MLRLATDSITSFSALPLRLATWLGAGGMLLCGLMVLGAFTAYLRGATVTGWASLYVAVLFLGAVQLLCLGLLGEYVARIYVVVQGRPSYFVGSDTLDRPDGPTGGDALPRGAGLPGDDGLPGGGDALPGGAGLPGGDGRTSAVSAAGGLR